MKGGKIDENRLREEELKRIEKQLALQREELKQRELKEYEKKMSKLNELRERFGTHEPSLFNRVLNTEERRMKNSLYYQ